MASFPEFCRTMEKLLTLTATAIPSTRLSSRLVNIHGVVCMYASIDQEVVAAVLVCSTLVHGV